MQLKYNATAFARTVFICTRFHHGFPSGDLFGTSAEVLAEISSSKSLTNVTSTLATVLTQELLGAALRWSKPVQQPLETLQRLLSEKTTTMTC